MKHKFTIWVFAIITNENNEVLIIHRTDKDIRNLPWWWLEWWESPEDGVIREVKQETGFDTVIDKLWGIYTKIKRNEVVLIFHCTVIWGTLCINNESDGFRYIDQSSIPENTAPKHIERIYDYYHQQHAKLTMKYQ